MDEVVHAEDAVDVARIIAEEDAPEGGEGTHGIGLEGDGGLDTASVGGGDKAYTSSRHDGGDYVVIVVARWVWGWV